MSEPQAVTRRPVAGDRRSLPVNEVGTVVRTEDTEDRIAMWTCERFDGQLWIMEGIGRSPSERDDYISKG